MDSIKTINSSLQTVKKLADKDGNVSINVAGGKCEKVNLKPILDVLESSDDSFTRQLGLNEQDVNSINKAKNMFKNASGVAADEAKSAGIMSKLLNLPRKKNFEAVYKNQLITNIVEEIGRVLKTAKKI